MYGLPDTTQVKKQLPKKAIYAKFGLKPSQREGFDADVSRIDIVAVVSPATIPAVAAGDNIKEFYVLAVQLKRKDYAEKNIEMLSKLIPQNILFALQYENQTQLAVYHTKFICSMWMPTDEMVITLSGLNLNTVWENIIKTVGKIQVQEGNTLAEQIAKDEERVRTLKLIAALEKRMAKETQPRKKRELFEQIKTLKKSTEQLLRITSPV